MWQSFLTKMEFLLFSVYVSSLFGRLLCCVEEQPFIPSYLVSRELYDFLNSKIISFSEIIFQCGRSIGHSTIIEFDQDHRSGKLQFYQADSWKRQSGVNPVVCLLYQLIDIERIFGRAIHDKIDGINFKNGRTEVTWCSLCRNWQIR